MIYLQTRFRFVMIFLILFSLFVFYFRYFQRDNILEFAIIILPFIYQRDNVLQLIRIYV